MYRLKVILLSLLLLPAAIMFMACDSGGSGGSGGGGGGGGGDVSADTRVVGQWEGELEDGGTLYDMFITISSTGVFQNILYYQSSSDHFGNMSDGEKGTISVTTSGSMAIKVNQDWSDGTWENKTTPDNRNGTYSFSTDENTLTINIADNPETTGEDESATIILTRGSAPVVDSNLTGTWVATGLTDDWDDDSTDNPVTVTVTLSSDGSFSWVKTDDSMSDLVIESYTGTYGVFWWSAEPSGGGYEHRFFAPIITTWSEREDAGSDLETYSVEFYQRMASLLNMFENPDEFILNVPDEVSDYTFVRQGTDPVLPSPDSSVLGYWLGVENDGGTDYDVIIRLDADNNFEKVLLYQLTATDYPGEMYAGERGEFMANNGELITLETDEWSSGLWSPPSPTADPHGTQYSIDGSVLTIIIDDEEKTFNSFAAPAVTTDLVGTWVCETTEDWDEEGGDDTIRITVEIDSSGNMAITEQDIDGTEFIYRYTTGTCGISAYSGTDYFFIFGEYMDEGTETTPVTLPIGSPTADYHVSRYSCELNTSADPDRFILNGSMIFEKQ